MHILIQINTINISFQCGDWIFLQMLKSDIQLAVSRDF